MNAGRLGVQHDKLLWQPVEPSWQRFWTNRSVRPVDVWNSHATRRGSARLIVVTATISSLKQLRQPAKHDAPSDYGSSLAKPTTFVLIQINGRSISQTPTFCGVSCVPPVYALPGLRVAGIAGRAFDLSNAGRATEHHNEARVTFPRGYTARRTASDSAAWPSSAETSSTTATVNTEPGRHTSTMTVHSAP